MNTLNKKKMISLLNIFYVSGTNGRKFD